MTDLNAVIAKARGWILNPYEKLGSMYEPSVKWYNPKTGEKLYTHDPDFQGDARLYMALADEMKCTMCYNRTMKKWLIYREGADIDCDSSIGDASDIGPAICQAYIKLNGLECEG